MLRTLFLLAAALTGIAAARADDNKVPADRKPTEEAYTDASFVANVASCNMLEVQLGQLAATKAKSEAVKKYVARKGRGFLVLTPTALAGRVRQDQPEISFVSQLLAIGIIPGCQTHFPITPPAVHPLL